MERRNTIQRTLVLNAVKHLGNHPTADEIYEFISKDYPSIGKGTVYRNLGILVQKKTLLKIEIPDASDRYDHNNAMHYHVRCISCGKVEDVTTKAMPDLKDCVTDAHDFTLTEYDILFKGLCPQCRETKTEEMQNGQ